MIRKVALKPNVDGFQVFENKAEIIKKFTRFVNENSLEKGSDTPDFMLAEYLFNCLQNYNDIMQRRERWWSCKEEQ